MKQALWSFVLILFLLTGCAGRSHTQPGTLPQPAAVSIENKGSDTMVNLALAWAERYQQVNPNARISVSGGGSGTGITSLISGTVDIANASRRITEEELAAARQAGYDPHEFTIARDAIAIIMGVVLRITPAWTLLGLLTAAIALPTALKVLQHAENIPALVPSMIQNVLLNLVTPLLMGVGFLIA